MRICTPTIQQFIQAPPAVLFIFPHACDTTVEASLICGHATVYYLKSFTHQSTISPKKAPTNKAKRRSDFVLSFCKRFAHETLRLMLLTHPTGIYVGVLGTGLLECFQ
jgi:hypothetical protein